MNPKAKAWLLNIVVLSVTAVVALVVVEFGARWILNASDYLSVEMVSDEVLGAVPSKNAAAGTFDDWGFRNRQVPTQADIVAIGDSHTFGNTATMEDSWPYVLGRLSGHSVYNMGLGGYGPNQYYALFQSKAFTLKPRTIVVGLYMGDDFENAFLMTYGREHWAYLREGRFDKVDVRIWGDTTSTPPWNRRVRTWLSGHSLAYQLVFHGPLLGRLVGQVKVQNAAASEGVTTLNVPQDKIFEAFLPQAILQRIDQGNPSILEGMRITFRLLKEMNDVSRERGTQFLVVVIPTKEMVFADYFERDPSVRLRDVVARLVSNEQIARERTFRFFGDAGIRYVDALPALKGARQGELYVRTSSDMHPAKNGYRVIAETVFSELNNSVRRQID